MTLYGRRIAASTHTEAAELARAHIHRAGGLASITDLAQRWGVSRSRAHELARRPDFPSPCAVVSNGTVALYAVVEADDWRRRPRPPGRPKKEVTSEGPNQAPMTRYVVVTREQRLPVQRFYTIEAAGNYIKQERQYEKWTVLAQDGNKITASTPYRELTQAERRQLEMCLYPTLFE